MRFAQAWVTFVVAMLTQSVSAGDVFLLAQRVSRDKDEVRISLKPARNVLAVDSVDEATPAQIQDQEEHPARKAITAVRIHDPHNHDLKHLQNYDAAVAGISKDANGFPDWMRALREGAIKPRSTLSGTDVPSDELNLDIIMKNTKEMPWVRFPHLPHTQWLTCSNCHPHPFEARTNSTKIKMADIFNGQYCGMCHDRVAFISFFSCMRCHSVPQNSIQADAPKQKK